MKIKFIVIFFYRTLILYSFTLILTADDSSVSQQNSHATESSTEDKDYEYLMGILPQLKELPKELKQKFKKDVHNLLTFAVIRGEKLKRKATETGSVVFYKCL